MGNQQQKQFQQRPHTAQTSHQYQNATIGVITYNQNPSRNNSRSKSRQNNRTVHTYATHTYKNNQAMPFTNNVITHNVRNNKIPQSPNKRPNIFSNNIKNPQFVPIIHQSPNNKRPPSNNRPSSQNKPQINFIPQQPQIPRPQYQNPQPQVEKPKQTHLAQSPNKKNANYYQQKRNKLVGMLFQGNLESPQGMTYLIKVRVNQE